MTGKLSPLCKIVNITMIEKEIPISQLASDLNMSRSYVSTIINGRAYSAPAVKKISDYLGIQDSATTTVSG